jgi:hypothetical protein
MTSLVAELAPIRVNTISPGAIVLAVEFLIGEAYVNGIDLAVDGGACG